MSDTSRLRAVKAESDALGMKPRRISHEEERPQRADYKRDVKPFVAGFGMALAAVGLGISLACYGSGVLLTYISGEPRWVWALVIIGVTALGYGIGAAIQVVRHEPYFLDRLWRITKDETEFEPPAGAVFLPTARPGYSKIPDVVSDDQRRDFCRAALDGTAPLSESGAKAFGYSRQQWETFRAWCMKRGILRWKDDANHNAGVDFAPGGRVAFETIIG